VRPGILSTNVPRIHQRLEAKLAPLRPLLDHEPLAGLLLASFAWTAADAAVVVGLLAPHRRRRVIAQAGLVRSRTASATMRRWIWFVPS
jgi:hypothetical protein